MKKLSKQNKSTKVKAMLDAGRSVTDIAKAIPCNRALVYMVRKVHFPEMGRKYKARKTKTKKLLTAKFSNNNSTVTFTPYGETLTFHPPGQLLDMVNSPAHYTAGGIEVYDFIKAKKLSYELGNVVKYVSRAEYKANKIEDLRKARWYLDAAIKKEEVV